MMNRVCVSYVCPVAPLDEGVIMSDGSVYTCKNHTRLRWFDTKPNGRLTFIGEITEDGKLKEAFLEPGNPMIQLKHYMNGKNPYDPSLDLDKPFTWERLKQFIQSIENIEAKGYVFECDCSARDLVRLPDETYESVHSHPYFNNLGD